MFRVLWCWLPWLLVVYPDKCSEIPSPYPTNFFDDMVPKFVNNRPLIGVAAMEVMGIKLLAEVEGSRGKDYFGASFVKLIESAGGRAVPVLEDITTPDLLRLLNKLNGFVLPGGDADVADSGYARVSKVVINYSKKLAKKGIKFPVVGICRGAQMMMIAESNKDFLVETDSLNLSIPLHFTKEAAGSRLFGHASKGLIKALGKRSITMNAHANGIPVDTFYNLTALTKVFRVLSTNYDRNGTNFISTFEGRHAPLYGLQWHPEKSLFVFNPVLAVDHSIYATIAAQYIANFFMAEARMNPNVFPSRDEELSHLVGAQMTPTFTGNITESPYDQVYLAEFARSFTYSKPDEDDNDDKDGNDKDDSDDDGGADDDGK